MRMGGTEQPREQRSSEIPDKRSRRSGSRQYEKDTLLVFLDHEAKKELKVRKKGLERGGARGARKERREL